MTNTRVRKTARKTATGFVGVQLTPELLMKLDLAVQETTLNRSQVIRTALIEYLKD